MHMEASLWWIPFYCSLIKSLFFLSLFFVGAGFFRFGLFCSFPYFHISLKLKCCLIRSHFLHLRSPFFMVSISSISFHSLLPPSLSPFILFPCRSSLYPLEFGSIFAQNGTDYIGYRSGWQIICIIHSWLIMLSIWVYTTWIDTHIHTLGHTFTCIHIYVN